MTERDPIVAVALAQRPVPDHAHGFWQELEAHLSATPTDTEPGEDTEATVIPLTDAPSRRRRRWLVLAAGFVSAAAVATVAIALVNDDERDDPGPGIVITDPDTVTTTELAPPTSFAPTPTPAPTLPPSTVPALETFAGVWPFTSYAEVAVYLASGSAEYADPRLVVERFATDIIGVVDPVVTLATSTDDGFDVAFEVRTRTEAGEVNNNLPPTIVSVRRVGDDTPTDPAGPWVVTGATSEDLTIDSPAAGTAVGSPLSVAGQGRGYEGTVSVSIHSGSTMIADPVATIAGNPERLPYAIDLTFEVPAAGTPLMLVARTDSGADFVGVPAFAVTRLVAGSGSSGAEPAQVVGAFLAAAGAGDTDTAWDLVDPGAQTAGGRRAAFDTFASDYGQDLIALAGVPLDAYATRRWSPTSENEPDVTVVTVSDRAVTDNVTATAFAVAANGKIVSTFPVARDPSIDAVSWVGNTTPAGQPLEILVPTSALAPTISIDADGTPIDPSSVQPFAGEPQSNATFPMPDDPGGHVLTLAFLRPDGLVHAEAQFMTFTAAGPAAATADQSVRQFLDAASRGDSAAAWALLDPAAQAANGDGIAFELSLQADDYGWAAFAALPDAAYSTRAWAPGTPGTQPETVVVTVAGDVTRNGTTQFDVVAFPVMRSTDGYRVVWTPTERGRSLPAPQAWPDGAIGGAPNGGAYFGVSLPDGTSDPAISEPGGDPTGPLDVADPVTYFEVPFEPSSQRVITLSYLDSTGLVHTEVGVYNL